MANQEYITDLDAVDMALGGVIALAYKDLAMDGPKAFQRFLQRDSREKILKSKNDDIQSALRRVARQQMEPDQKALDLPLIIYYRDMGLAIDPLQKTQVIETVRYIRDDEQENRMQAMRLTAMPVTLTYSILFLAWDRVTLERMTLAWWGYVAPRYRAHSRFHVRYKLDGETVEVPASLNTPREILTSNEQIDEQGGRLWGARTMCEVNTQALYAAKIVTPASIDVERIADVIPG